MNPLQQIPAKYRAASVTGSGKDTRFRFEASCADLADLVTSFTECKSNCTRLENNKR